MTTNALTPDERSSQSPGANDRQDDRTQHEGAATVTGKPAMGHVEIQGPTVTSPNAIHRRASARPSLGVFGAYELLEIIAEGGMGVVYKARDAVLNRVVALKTLRAGSRAGVEEVERFYREARAAAMFSHPHIVPVYEVGRHEDHHYFCMAFISGGNLTAHKVHFSGNPRKAVALLEKVARAVHYAHSKGVLHRDLKPSNILLDERGEPQVSDFGLAKILDGDVELTQTGVALGTPPYMSPEQSTGGIVGPGTDVWSLGVVLYELLVGRRPFLADERGGLMQAIRHGNPPRPCALAPDLDPALEIIILRCLEKEPAWRYRTTEALADDLRRWLDGEEIATPPSRRMVRAWRRHSRSLLVAGLGLTAATAVSAALILAAVWLRPSPVPVPVPQAAEGPSRPLDAEDLRLQIKRGQTVTLVGDAGVEAGRSPAFQWAVGRDDSTVELSRSQPLEVKTSGKALLELLSDAPAMGCLLRAEVRVRGPGAEAGVYFGAGRIAVPPAAECCGTLTLRKGQALPAANDEIEFSLRRVRSFEAKEAPNISHTFLSRPYPSTDAWRRLEVRLSAAGVRVSCDGDLLIQRSSADLNQYFKRVLATPVNPVHASFAYNPAGALGLFASRGKASFRRVVVEPLSESPRANP